MTTEQDTTDTVVSGAEELESTGTEAETLDVHADESKLDDEPDVAEPVSDADVDGTGTEPPRTRGGLARVPWLLVALALALVAAAGLTAWMYFSVYQPERQTDDAAQRSALDAATAGTKAILTYSPDSLDKDFANAKSKLTGDFLSYYTQFTEQIVTPAAKQKSVKTTASVVRSGLAEMKPDQATVLVFVNQTTQSADRPDASFTNSSVRVTLKKIDGTWLISAFDPV